MRTFIHRYRSRFPKYREKIDALLASRRRHREHYRGFAVKQLHEERRFQVRMMRVSHWHGEYAYKAWLLAIELRKKEAPAPTTDERAALRTKVMESQEFSDWLRHIHGKHLEATAIVALNEASERVAAYNAFIRLEHEDLTRNPAENG